MINMPVLPLEMDFAARAVNEEFTSIADTIAQRRIF
jgi:hypothetical protein